jgi:DNA-binding NarL/FixJ family response regulator
MARSRLGEGAAAAAHAAGHALTVEQALSEIDRVVAAAGGAGDELTARELEVVGLVADGLSNADVAARLVVSTRTVHAHLRSIYRKLSVHSRTAAARAAAERGLV